MKEYSEDEEQFCVDLQTLLDKYKVLLSVPTIMRNAQDIFHQTLSFREHPELHKVDLSEVYVDNYKRDVENQWTPLKDIMED